MSFNNVECLWRYVKSQVIKTNQQSILEPEHQIIIAIGEIELELSQKIEKLAKELTSVEL